MKRTAWTTALALCLAIAAPAGALAAGGPVAPVQDSYIASTGSPYRYAAFKDAFGDTVVREEEAGAARAGPALRIRGHYGIPGVDYSGGVTGLSADGRTLVLARIPAGVPHTTHLIVLDTAPLAIRGRLTLPGFSTVDAISPDGQWLYLIHYASADITRYEVLGYDMRAHRLLTQPVVDPRDRDEAMTGIPINRVMSAGGRWAYTLYLRPSGVPFVHALDTAHHQAACIDLRPLANTDISSAHLVLLPGGTTLGVNLGGVTEAVVDTRTFKVTGAPAHRSPISAPREAHAHRAASPASGVAWELILMLIAAVGLTAAGGAAALRRKRRLNYDRAPDGSVIIHVDARPPEGMPDDHELPVA
jgi:hypothetical protein